MGRIRGTQQKRKERGTKRGSAAPALAVGKGRGKGKAGGLETSHVGGKKRERGSKRKKRNLLEENGDKR